MIGWQQCFMHSISLNGIREKIWNEHEYYDPRLMETVTSDQFRSQLKSIRMYPFHRSKDSIS